MKRGIIAAALLPCLLGLAVELAPAAAPTTAAAITRAADRLVDQQTSGTWGEAGYIGEPVIGLANLYSLVGPTEGASYKIAADAGGQKILWNAGYTVGTHTYLAPLYASEAYAISRLSVISTPGPDPWGTALTDLFAQIRDGYGTVSFAQGIISDYGPAGATDAVHDLARYTVAAHSAGELDVGFWRSALADALVQIDDNSEGPVMALGAAVWGLAATGPMDNTPLPGGTAYFAGKKLEDLPGMLAGFQVSDGSFRWKLVDDVDQASGYTEVTAMATLGLNAAYRGDEPVFPYGYEILDAITNLQWGVDDDGAAMWRTGDPTSQAKHYLAGETLEVATLLIPGDADGNGYVDDDDLSLLLANWTGVGGTGKAWSTGDFEGDGDVADDDLSLLLSNWTGPPPSPLAVPEPTAVALLLPGVVGLMLRRRR